jgi:hypothetical protein
MKNLSLFINGNPTTSFLLDDPNNDFPYIQLSEVVEDNEVNSDINGSPYNRTTIAGMQTHTFKVNPEKIIGKTLIISGYSSSTGNWDMYVYGSYDNIDYAQLKYFSSRSAAEFEVLIEEPFEYLKFNGGWVGNNIRLIAIKGEKGKITFNTPPPEGAIITADYTVPYIPKTEDYVLDVTMEIQFGEGV